MEQSTITKAVGAYGIIRGIIGVALGVVLVIGNDSIASILGSIEIGSGVDLGGLESVVGGLALLAGVVLVAAAIGLFVEKSWGLVASFVGFGLLALSGIIVLVSGGVVIGALVLVVVDLVATTWTAMNAPEIPIGDTQTDAQAV